jgi:hypothetical protein
VPRNTHPPELTALFAPLDGNSIACILAHLDPECIVDRLQELEREASSLRLLLRAVRARRRDEARATTTKGVNGAGQNGTSRNGNGVPHD